MGMCKGGRGDWQQSRSGSGRIKRRQRLECSKRAASGQQAGSKQRREGVATVRMAWHGTISTVQARAREEKLHVMLHEATFLLLIAFCCQEAHG